jgi:hypothetical protein
VVAYADLGGLGANQGPPSAFIWKMPLLVPLLLPWLAILVSLALPSNRDRRAWWIWAPLIALVLLGVTLRAAGEAFRQEAFAYFLPASSAAAFGLTAIWLLGTSLVRRCTALAIVLSALAFAGVALLAFLVSPVSELVEDLSQWEKSVFLYLVLFWLTAGMVFSGAFNLTGRMCRGRPTRLRISLWLPFWFWILCSAAAWVANSVRKLVSGEDFDWNALLVAPIILALVSFATLLPFLILSFTNAFYFERLKHLLRLPPAAPAPQVPIPAPPTAPEVADP